MIYLEYRICNGGMNVECNPTVDAGSVPLVGFGITHLSVECVLRSVLRIIRILLIGIIDGGVKRKVDRGFGDLCEHCGNNNVTRRHREGAAVVRRTVDNVMTELVPFIGNGCQLNCFPEKGGQLGSRNRAVCGLNNGDAVRIRGEHGGNLNIPCGHDESIAVNPLAVKREVIEGVAFRRGRGKLYCCTRSCGGRGSGNTAACGLNNGNAVRICGEHGGNFNIPCGHDESIAVNPLAVKRKVIEV